MPNHPTSKITTQGGVDANQPRPIETCNMLDLSRQNTEIKRDLEEKDEDEQNRSNLDEDEDSADNLDDIDEKGNFQQSPEPIDAMNVDGQQNILLK